MHTMAHHRRSLAMSVTLQTALVTAIAMAAYAIFQYVTMPGQTVAGLLVEHGWHVAVLGLLTYAVIYTVMDRQVIRPVRDLYLKCYAITRGDLTPIEVDSSIAEIQEIADGINLMVDRIPKGRRDVELADLTYDGERLRDFVTHGGEEFTAEARSYLLSLADRLETGTPASQALG